MKLFVVTEIQKKSEAGRCTLAHDGGISSAGHAHLRERTDTEDEYRIKNNIDHSTCDLRDHGKHCPAGGLQQPLKSDLQEQTDADGGDDGEIGIAELPDLGISRLCTDKRC